MRNRAFVLGVLNGVFFGGVMAMTEPGTVLSAFCLRITGSTFIATLPLAIMRLGWFWPQLFVSNIAEARLRKKPFYIAAGLGRMITLALIISTVYVSRNSNPSVLAGAFLLLYFVYSSCAGVSGIPFWDIVAKVVPANRRGRFMGLRGFFGGVLGFFSGFYVRFMLSDSGPDFPVNYSLIFLTAFLLLGVALGCFFAVPEPIGSSKKKRGKLRDHIREGISIFGTDRNYRLLYLARILSSISWIGGVVFVPYAIKALGLPESNVGIFLAISTCFSLPSNFLWSYIGDKYGNRLLMLISTGFSLIIPVIAILSGMVPDKTVVIPIVGAEMSLRAVIFMSVFAISGLTSVGQFMGDANYLLDIAPEIKRPSYIAFMSVLLSPTALVPLLGGMLAEMISFRVTFLLSMLFGAAAYVTMFRLDEPRRGEIHHDE